MLQPGLGVPPGRVTVPRGAVVTLGTPLVSPPRGSWWHPQLPVVIVSVLGVAQPPLRCGVTSQRGDSGGRGSRTRGDRGLGGPAMSPSLSPRWGQGGHPCASHPGHAATRSGDRDKGTGDRRIQADPSPRMLGQGEDGTGPVLRRHPGQRSHHGAVLHEIFTVPSPRGGFSHPHRRRQKLFRAVGPWHNLRGRGGKNASPPSLPAAAFFPPLAEY